MAFGFILILAGVLIALYPPLLSIIVASLLILSGVLLMFISYSYRKLARSSQDPVARFFLRF